MQTYIKADGQFFCKGQKVEVSPGHYWTGLVGRVGCSQNLLEYYNLTNKIPVLLNKGEDFAADFYPNQLKILTLKRNMKGGVGNMPRIFKFGLYLLLVVAAWKLLPLVDLLLQFVSRLISK